MVCPVRHCRGDCGARRFCAQRTESQSGLSHAGWSAGLAGRVASQHHHATRASRRVRGQAVSDSSRGERISGETAGRAQSRYLAGASRPERPIGERILGGDRGELAVVAGRIPTSLVVDPADGRIPPLTSDRRAKPASRPEVRRQGASAAAFNTSERCLRDGGAPLFRSPDRGLIEIIQTNTHVVIRQENLHETRVIPLDGRPHVASAIRSWVGDPRGSWNGDVLIVDSTNFTDLGDRFDENLHLVERFSRIDSETLLYEFTVDDPTVYTRPWTVVMPLKRSSGLLFEDACHEGNYSLPSMLRAVRVQEASR